MKGSYEIIVRNNRLRYKFTIHRNITILRGNSATGKTTLIEMIKSYLSDGLESGIEVLCDRKCVVLERGNWERDLKDFNECIVFIDEGNGFIKTTEFAEMVKNSSNYYVIATRENLFNLPYSIEEIYGIRNTSGNIYQGTKRLYSELYHLYNKEAFEGRPDKVIIEDSNSAYQFFKEVCQKERIECVSAKGKSNIFKCILEAKEEKILVIADGAAFGPEMERVMSLKWTKHFACFLPESFEWLILNSGLIKAKDLKSILESPSDFIESEKYISWERFFTKLLIDETKDTPLAYNKSTLNSNYLHDKNVKTVIKAIDKEAGGALMK